MKLVAIDLKLSPEDEDLRSNVVSLLTTRSSKYLRTCWMEGENLLHRHVMRRISPEYKPTMKMVVDHIDGDHYNNTRENLRLIDRSEHSHNRKAGKHNKSGYKNVCNSGKYFWARLTANRVIYNGKCHTDPREAYLDYLQMHRDLLGRDCLRATQEDIALSVGRKWRKEKNEN